MRVLYEERARVRELYADKGPGWTVWSTHVNCRKHRYQRRAETAKHALTKTVCGRMSLSLIGTRRREAPPVERQDLDGVKQHGRSNDNHLGRLTGMNVAV